MNAAGAPLVQYDFESSTTFLSPSTTDTSLVAATAITATNGPYVRSTGNPPSGLASLAIVISNIDDSTQPAPGAATTDNLAFTVTPAAGHTTLPGLGSLTFFSNFSSTSTGTPVRYTVQYDDLNDGAGFQDLLTFVETSGTATLRSIDLSGAPFQNIGASGVAFRIDFNRGATSGTSARVDEITLNVPEPGSIAFVFGGALLLLARRRS